MKHDQILDTGDCAPLGSPTNRPAPPAPPAPPPPTKGLTTPSPYDMFRADDAGMVSRDKKPCKHDAPTYMGVCAKCGENLFP